MSAHPQGPAVACCMCEHDRHVPISAVSMCSNACSRRKDLLDHLVSARGVDPGSPTPQTQPREPENAHNHQLYPPRLSARDIEHVRNNPHQYRETNWRQGNEDALLLGSLRRLTSCADVPHRDRSASFTDFGVARVLFTSQLPTSPSSTEDRIRWRRRSRQRPPATTTTCHLAPHSLPARDAAPPSTPSSSGSGATSPARKKLRHSPAAMISWTRGGAPNWGRGRAL